jgi:TrmH family RNA methyltransferase
VATDARADRSVYSADLRGPTAWAFGNEGAGLSSALAAAATLRVAIPMPGAAESLNVAAAAAICLFEQVRQRGA